MVCNESPDPASQPGPGHARSNYRVFLERSLAGTGWADTGWATGSQSAEDWRLKRRLDWAELTWRDVTWRDVISELGLHHLTTSVSAQTFTWWHRSEDTEWDHLVLSCQSCQPPPLLLLHCPHHAAAPPRAWQEHRGRSLSLSVSELKSASSPEQFGLQGPCQLIVKKQLTNHNIPSQP